jgi:hypothetical protein
VKPKLNIQIPAIISATMFADSISPPKKNPQLVPYGFQLVAIPWIFTSEHEHIE